MTDLLQNQPLISLNPNTRIVVQTKNNTVIPAPKTGRVVINNIDTKNIDQIIKSQFKLLIPEFRLNWRVAKKVIAPASDEAPKKCKLRIAKDTAADVEKSAPERG